MSNETNQAQAQNPLMRLIIYVATFFALYYAYTWWADKEAKRLMRNAYDDAAEYQREAEADAEREMQNSGY